MLQNAYKIVSSFEANCPAEFVMKDGKKQKEVTIGIWNPEPDDRDDLYVCLFNPAEYESPGLNDWDDALDVFQMDDILTPDAYEQLQSALFDYDDHFEMALSKKDFSIHPTEILEDELKGELAKKEMRSIEKQQQFDMEM
ncbi:hypothetical protein [Oceanobacillus kimchii]|uniref:DUF3013 family protein n=1 Tax=Oceanobacillus kimchii TaxID=746691 RepID=A0ABQ5TE40_9BACI|nr:hypothetical protein [Oceanobacillus kimchii]GLO65058.1 hypothetical protein MACH08_08420 [Oceanobacillus kimchii]